jgi:O-antigen ligase
MNWEGVGLGTISYNHAHAAATILILAALLTHLANSRVLIGIVLSLATLVMFLTGSRAGLASIVLYFAAMLVLERSWRMLAAVSVLVPLAILALVTSEADLGEIVDRQAQLLETPSTETLSERDVIWKSRLEFLDQDKVRWLVGTGFGSASASGDNAHNMYLHVIVETGVVGLVVFMSFFVYLMALLRSYLPDRPAYLVGTLCLLFSALTQETLYPVAAQGFTLPFYLIAFAIVLGTSRRPREPVPAAIRRPRSAEPTRAPLSATP